MNLSLDDHNNLNTHVTQINEVVDSTTKQL